MRDVCKIDVIVSTKISKMAPIDAATHVFEHFRGCRVLSAFLDGPHLKTEMLLPEIRGGYREEHLPALKPFIEEGLYGKGVVFLKAHSVREATTAEILQKAIAGRKR